MCVRQGALKVVEFPSGLSRVDSEALDLFEALLIRWMGRVWPDVRVTLSRGAGWLVVPEFRALKVEMLLYQSAPASKLKYLFKMACRNSRYTCKVGPSAIISWFMNP